VRVRAGVHTHVQDMDVRWNTTFDMLARFIEINSDMRSAATMLPKKTQLRAKLDSITSSRMKQLDYVMRVLQPFKTATLTVIKKRVSFQL
jgi:hypothetical protein